VHWGGTELELKEYLEKQQVDKELVEFHRSNNTSGFLQEEIM